MLALIAEHGLVNGERIGVDASTMEANAALRTIVRRETGETYREMLKRMAEESGIATPSVDDLVRLDRARKGKKLSNADWVSRTDPDAKIAKMKDGTTHLAYKPEHAVDLDTGAVVAAEIHPADEGDTTTLSGTLEAAAANLAKSIGRRRRPRRPNSSPTRVITPVGSLRARSHGRMERLQRRKEVANMQNEHERIAAGRYALPAGQTPEIGYARSERNRARRHKMRSCRP